MASGVAQFEPLICATTTYMAVFGLAHLLKMGVDRGLKRGTRPHTFLLEAITALQMCVCVYENGIIIGNYGLLGFFIAVSLLLIAAGFTNRGFFGNILGHLEQLIGGGLSITDFAIILVGQFIGSALALRSAQFLWYQTAFLSASHTKALGANLCGFTYHYPLNYVMCFEALYCMVLRILIGQFMKTTFRRRYLIPVLVSGHLAASIKFIGVAGLNPMTAYARLAMCDGLNDAHFFYTYWAGAAVGWMFGAHIQHTFNVWWTGRSKAAKSAAEQKEREARKAAKKNEKKRK